VAEGVVRADRDQPDPGTAGGQEAGVGVRAAVVRHLEHVGPQVDFFGDQAGLGLGAEIAGHEHPDAANSDPDDQ
jgi:hypothetical protein